MSAEKTQLREEQEGKRKCLAAAELREFSWLEKQI